MANTRRRYRDKNGNQFLPMNVEGTSYNDNFWNTKKLIVLAVILLSLGFLISYLSSSYVTISTWIIDISIWLIISTYIIRYIIFEEKFYYAMYKERQGNEVTTPGKFWNVASIKDTDDGAILTYSDAKVGVIIKVDRDTITGKDDDFEEIHYDAISDFYKELLSRGYNFVQMNLMEPAGKDPRLLELDKLVAQCQNENVKKLIELQVGHIKNIAQASLYETDYILVWTYDITRIDYIIQDMVESLFKLLNGAYIGYGFLNKREIIDLEKELFGVKYFNATDASLNIYRSNASMSVAPFVIDGIKWIDDIDEEIQWLDNRSRNKLRSLTSCIIEETKDISEISIKDAIYVKKEKTKVGIDFSKLSDMPLDNRQGINNSNGHSNSQRHNNIVRPNPNRQQQYSNNRNNANQSNINLNKDVNHQNLFEDGFLDDDDDLIDI